MAKRASRTRAGVVVGLAAAALVCGSETLSAQEVAVVVHVEDYARMPSGDWDVVRQEVERIYAEAGVELTWAGPLRIPAAEWPRDGRRRVALTLVNIEAPFAADPKDTSDVLGRAAADVSRVWVFANRITQAASESPIDRTLLMARVVAHEIGHVLLPNQRHADRGIMKASLELAQVGFFAFTPDQARALRDGIREHTTRAAQ